MVDITTQEQDFGCLVPEDSIEQVCKPFDLLMTPVLSIDYPVIHQELNPGPDQYQIVFLPIALDNIFKPFPLYFTDGGSFSSFISNVQQHNKHADTIFLNAIVLIDTVCITSSASRAI